MLGSLKIPGAGVKAAVFLAQVLVGTGVVPVLSSTRHAPTWIPVEVPHAAVVAVTCPSAGSCVAVGSYDEMGGHLHGLLATFSRGTWAAALAPLPPNASPQNPGDSYLSGVACRGTGFCVAVGWYTSVSGDPHGLLETLAGGKWTPLQAPLPANVTPGSAASLTAVACPSVRSCVAVGSYFDPRPAALGLIETFSGGHWTALQPRPPPNANSAPDVFLQTVTCPAVGACVTVGSYNDTGGNIPGLIETLAHGTWIPTEVARAAVFAVTCPSAGSCVAVGSVYGLRGQLHGLIETLSRGTWTGRQAPLPANAATNRSPVLDAVTCPAVGSCIAVGAYTNAKRDHDGLIDALSGSIWRPAKLTLPAGVDAHHDALTCVTAASCIAVGSYLDTSGTILHGLVETLSGGTWTTSRAPLPTNAEGANPVASFNDMTCPTPGTCVAVGWYRDTSGATQGLIETPSEKGYPR